MITNLVFLSELVVVISFQVVIVLSKFRNRDWWMVHHGQKKKNQIKIKLKIKTKLNYFILMGEVQFYYLVNSIV